MTNFEYILRRGHLKPYVPLVKEAFPLYQWRVSNTKRTLDGKFLLGEWKWGPNHYSYIHIYFSKSEHDIHYKDRLMLSFEMATIIEHQIMGKNLEKPEEFIKRFQDEVAKEAILTADSRLRFAKRASEEYKENPTETTLNSLEIHCHLAEASLTLLQSFQGKYKADQLQLL